MSPSTPILLRSLIPRDRHVVVDVFEQLSPLARYYRFHQMTPLLHGSMVEALSRFDDRDHLGMGAFVDGRPVGIARVVRDHDDVGEVAIEVGDAHAGQGVGGQLLDALLERAAAAGFSELYALVKPDNEAAVALFERRGFVFRRGFDSLEGRRSLAASLAA